MAELFSAPDAWDFLERLGDGTLVWGVNPEPGTEVVTHRRVVGPPRTVDGRFFGGLRSLAEVDAMLRHAVEGRYGLLFLPGTAQLGLMWCDIDDASVAGLKWDTIAGGLPLPTWVTNTGRGQHLLWALDAPLEPSGDARHRESVRAVASLLGGDRAVSNGTAQRLRLPGSTNFPNAKKRATGRVPSRVTFARCTGEEMLTCSLSSFPREVAQRGQSAVSQLTLGSAIADLVPITASDVASIEALSRFVDAQDRSSAAMAVLWALSRGRTPEQVRRVALEAGTLPGHVAFSAYVASRPQKWLSRSLSKIFANQP